MNLNLCSSPTEARNEGSIYHLFLSFGVEALSDKLGSFVRATMAWQVGCGLFPA
jgi:hypothetical protein